MLSQQITIKFCAMLSLIITTSVKNIILVPFGREGVLYFHLQKERKKQKIDDHLLFFFSSILQPI